GLIVVDFVEADAEFTERGWTEGVQVLKGNVVVLNTLCAGEVRDEAVDHVVAMHGGESAEDPVCDAELMIQAGEILVLIKDVGNGPDDVRVQDVVRGELRKRQIFVYEILGVLIDPAGW